MPPSKPTDSKARALKQRGALNPTPEDVIDELFQTHDFFDPRDLVQVKYEMLRRTRHEGASVTESARSFGFSRPSFYAARSAFEDRGLVGLLPRKRGPRSAHKLTDEVLRHVEELRSGEERVTLTTIIAKLQERFELRVHRRSLERALARRGKKRS